MQQDLDIRYLLAIFWRRLPAFLTAALLVFAGFAATAMLLPPSYRSSATILVESQQIPGELARSTITATAVERIRTIEQRVMTRQTLLEVARNNKAFTKRKDMTPSDIYQAMRDSIKFEVVSFGSRRKGSNATVFTITVTAASAKIATSIANELVTLILEQNVRLRTARASETYEFFKQESERLSSELAAIERGIVEFKRANRDTLPESLDYRRNRLNLAQQRQSLLEREVAGLLEQRRILVKAQKNPAAFEQRNPRDLSQNERDLAQLKRDKTQRRAILSENHPQIIALNSRIKALETAIAEEAAARQGAEVDDAGEPQTAAAGRIDQEIELIDSKLNQTRDELKELEREGRELERSIVETPNVEMALTSLTRDYANMQQQYQSARVKLANAATGEQLELKQQAERFSVIEQATAPDRPFKPNRALIMLMGVGGGLGAGFAVMLLLEFMNKAIRRPSELIKHLDIQPLAVIPYVYTVGESRSRRRRGYVLLTLFAGSVAIGLFLVDRYYLPLGLLAEKAMDAARIDTLIDRIRVRLNF